MSDRAHRRCRQEQQVRAGHIILLLIICYPMDLALFSSKLERPYRFAASCGGVSKLHAISHQMRVARVRILTLPKRADKVSTLRRRAKRARSDEGNNGEIHEKRFAAVEARWFHHGIGRHYDDRH